MRMHARAHEHGDVYRKRTVVRNLRTLTTAVFPPRAVRNQRCSLLCLGVQSSMHSLTMLRHIDGSDVSAG
eukprot:13173079-Alexandrium_andersonii.AAC.1